MRLLRDFVFLNVGVFITNVGGYAYQLLASRGLSVVDYGFWNIFASLYVIANVPGLALNLVVARRVAELAAGGHGVRSYLQRLAWRVAVSLGGGILCLVVVTGVLRLLVPALPTVLVLFIGLAIAVNFALPLPLGALQGLQHFELFSLGMATRSILTLVLGGLFVALGTGLPGVLGGIASGNIGALALCALLVLAVLRRRWGATVRAGRVTADAVSENYLLVTVTYAFITLLLYLDTLLAPHFLGAEQAGYYAVVAVASRSIYYAPTALIAIIVPRVAGLAVRGRDTRLVLLGGSLLMLATTLPILLVFAGLPRLVLRLMFGTVYAESPAAVFLPWYAGAVVLLTVAVFLVHYFLACRRLLYLGALAAGLATLGLNLALWHETPADLVRAIFWGNGVAASLLIGLAVITVLRPQRRLKTEPPVVPAASPTGRDDA